MHRARYPLAVAALAAGLALIPAATASAASPLDGTPLGSVVGQLQDGLSSASGSGSSSTPDVQGSLTTFAACLQAAGSATSTSASSTATPTETETSTPTETSTSTSTATTDATQKQVQKQTVPQVVQPSGVLGPAVDVPADPLTPILAAGQTCVENLFAGLGATQAQCFSANGFDATTLSNVVKTVLSGSAPDMTELQNDLTGLLACLSGGTPTDSGGGGDVATDSPTPEPTVVTSDEAPAAVAVTGTPNFTG